MGERAGLVAKAPEVKQSNSNSRVRKTERLQSMDTPVDRILFLQKTAGNQAVSRLMKSGALQAKLSIGQPGDVYEQEADRVMEQVMRMPEPGVQRQVEPEEEEEEKTNPAKSLVGQITPVVQRQPKPLEEEVEEKQIQPKSNTDMAPQVTPGVAHDIHSLKGKGQPLPASERAFFETRFGRDFSNVHVHTDHRSTLIARSINAHAFTLGRDVVFGAGQFSPGTHSGRKLIAHELTHVVQQNVGDNIKSKMMPTSLFANESASDLAFQLDANAFTYGNEIFFGAGTFAHRDSARRKLLAHELVHVLQQSNSNQRIQKTNKPISWTTLFNYVNRRYAAFILKQALINQKVPTQQRGKWIIVLTKWWSKLGKLDEKKNYNLNKLLRINRYLKLVKNLFILKNKFNRMVWYNLSKDTHKEMFRLASLRPDELWHEYANRILARKLSKSTKNVIATTNYLMREDFLALEYTMKKRTHIASGKRIAKREISRIRKILRSRQRHRLRWINADFKLCLDKVAEHEKKCEWIAKIKCAPLLFRKVTRKLYEVCVFESEKVCERTEKAEEKHCEEVRDCLYGGIKQRKTPRKCGARKWYRIRPLWPEFKRGYHYLDWGPELTDSQIYRRYYRYLIKRARRW